MSDASGPLDGLEVIRHQQVDLGPTLVHHELYTWDGLLTLLWHRPEQPSTDAVLYCGGALGGVLGPADAIYHHLGTVLAASGVATGIRVGYRVPNDLDRCVTDVVAAAGLAAAAGARRFVVVGHSFGGAVAIGAGVAIGDACAGVVTLATQSAGCEPGEALAERRVPVLLLHGDQDPILPFFASQLVHMLCGGELSILAGADHGLGSAAEELRQRLVPWITARFA